MTLTPTTRVRSQPSQKSGPNSRTKSLLQDQSLPNRDPDLRRVRNQELLLQTLKLKILDQPLPNRGPDPQRASNLGLLQQPLTQKTLDQPPPNPDPNLLKAYNPEPHPQLPKEKTRAHPPKKVPPPPLTNLPPPRNPRAPNPNRMPSQLPPKVSSRTSEANPRRRRIWSTSWTSPSRDPSLLSKKLVPPFSRQTSRPRRQSL